jgi:hypothetical protein
MTDIPEAISDAIASAFIEAEAAMATDGTIDPVLFFYSPHTDAVAFIPTAWTDQEHRATIITVARSIGVAHRANRALWVTEAWVSKLPMGGDVTDLASALKRHAEAPEDADRMEVVIATGCWRTAAKRIECAVAAKKIIRDEAGAFKALEELHAPVGDARTWIRSLLLPVEVTPSLAAVAKEHLALMGIDEEDFIFVGPTLQ